MSFEKAVVAQAIDKLFNKERHFSICTVDEIAKILGVNAEAHPSYKLLHALHCVHYADMSPEILRELPMRVLDVLRPGTGVNAALFAHALCAEGSDFTHTEDRYIDVKAPQLRRIV